MPTLPNVKQTGSKIFSFTFDRISSKVSRDLTTGVTRSLAACLARRAERKGARNQSKARRF
jgi:hypothetical protein